MHFLPRKISDATIRRLSAYLRELERQAGAGTETVSSGELADGVGTTAPQVRKDLSIFGSFGKRGTGYRVETLSGELRAILAVDREWRVVLIGAGRIGAALHAYPGFRDRGFQIVAVLDVDREKVGREVGESRVAHVDTLEEVIRGEGVELAILAVPAGAAVELARRAVEAGVRGILNFAPVRLDLPEEIAVNPVNLAAELEVLSYSIEGRKPR